MKHKITLNSFERQVLLDAAAILGRVPADEAEHFELRGYDECFELKDQADNLREMVGWSDGTIQYEQRIGPAPKPITRAEFDKVLKAALDRFGNALQVSRNYEQEFSR